MNHFAALQLIALSLLGAPAILASSYLFVATLLSWRLPHPRPSERTRRFDVMVPAHNEAAVIARTVVSLRKMSWPATLYRIIVIADNCSDQTAAIAMRAGALVLERSSAVERGKGYALRFGFNHCLREGWSDAIVVVDADTEVSGNLLEAFASRLEQGAQAVQSHYGVLNPNASWRTRLITIAKGAIHIVRSRARERLRLSCGIRGNGWCVTRHLLEKVPYEAYSLTEDLEYGLDLGMAGYRVHYADEAHADGEMVSSAAVASNQRRRWEFGRFHLVRTRTLPLLRAALRARSLMRLDLALDLIVMPLSYLVINIVIFGFCAWLGFQFDAGYRIALWVSGACIFIVILYVLRGWQLSGVGWRGLVDLIWAPFFVAWKLWSILGRRNTKEWVRTDREGP
jgi:cellulose synthase/poly-beta-1,6-N-acetylglucosamine synthase-like glycosyltransferase